jgi:hypothetical protein
MVIDARRRRRARQPGGEVAERMFVRVVRLFCVFVVLFVCFVPFRMIHQANALHICQFSFSHPPFSRTATASGSIVAAAPKVWRTGSI